jgi:hypothetical protein
MRPSQQSMPFQDIQYAAPFKGIQYLMTLQGKEYAFLAVASRSDNVERPSLSNGDDVIGAVAITVENAPDVDFIDLTVCARLFA